MKSITMGKFIKESKLKDKKEEILLEISKTI
jgi:hypothetical protein